MVDFNTMLNGNERHSASGSGEDNELFRVISRNEAYHSGK